MQLSLEDAIEIVKADITDKHSLQDKNIDTIVNAANPTLMGSNQGVDGAIHAAVPKLNEIICDTLDTDRMKNRIRCNRGEAVLTPGGGLCKNIIHVVGGKNDSPSTKVNISSSSRIELLTSCYHSIVDIIKKHPEIENVAIPVVGAGDYGFHFEMAVRIEISSIANALLEWKEKDFEIFNLAGLKKIYIYVYHSSITKREKNYNCAVKIMNKYRPILKKTEELFFNCHCFPICRV